MISNSARVHAGFRIDGRVQGVGFRRWTARRAGAYGLAGTVRNRADGSVEVMVVGDSDEVRCFLSELKDGPRFAKVDGIVKVPCTLPLDASGFVIL